MELTAKELYGLWGMAFALSAPLIFLLIVVCPRSWLKWLIPLMVSLPLAIHISGVGYFSQWAIYQGIILGVFLYALGFMLVILVEALRKPKKELGK